MSGLPGSASCSGRSSSSVSARTAQTFRAKRVPKPSTSVHWLYEAKRLAGAALLSAGILSGQAVGADCAFAADSQVAVAPPPFRALASLPLASASVAAAPLVAAPSVLGLVEEAVVEAEHLAGDVWGALTHGAEALGGTMHHLQVLHALEHLQDMTVEQVVDIPALQAALHPAAASGEPGADGQEGGAVDEAAAASWARLDAALAAVGPQRLGAVLDLDKLAAAVQDVSMDGPVPDARALRAAAPRIRRSVHWEALAGAVREPGLAAALREAGGSRALAELDIRAALAALRMDTVGPHLAARRRGGQQEAYGAQRGAQQGGLNAGGLWTWES